MPVEHFVIPSYKFFFIYASLPKSWDKDEDTIKSVNVLWFRIIWGEYLAMALYFHEKAFRI